MCFSHVRYIWELYRVYMEFTWSLHRTHIINHCSTFSDWLCMLIAVMLVDALTTDLDLDSLDQDVTQPV